ncbi:DsbA family protein [Natronomonas salina]|uniref:DsbA family protein n=1 Tax=Natronomonas salina TaxID=1710540 RepID=UPI0015B5E080|nr:thioredoxin domain-containing protein [Natronomonas salina]QLD89632.1 DsbA family protein [Natronomonas salina]
MASSSESNDQEYTPSDSHADDGTSGFGIELAGRPIAGDTDAPIDIYYWTDYLCPFCKEFETETLPKLGSNHIETGDVRLVTLFYPNIGEYSMPSAVWGRCVWQQVVDSGPGAFWKWHSAAFDAQAGDGHDWADEETFRQITEETNAVAVSDVDACRNSRGEAVRESINDDLDAGVAANIQGTPGFVLYNRETDTAGKLVGAHPYENFSKAIEQVRDA